MDERHEGFMDVSHDHGGFVEQTRWVIPHGSRVRDKISHFEGLVTARNEYDNGCIRYCVRATKLTQGEIKEEWVDEQHLEIVITAKAEIMEDLPGGARPAPPNRDPAMRG